MQRAFLDYVLLIDVGRLKCLFNRCLCRCVLHAHAMHANAAISIYVMTCKVPYMHVSGAHHLHDAWPVRGHVTVAGPKSI